MTDDPYDSVWDSTEYAETEKPDTDSDDWWWGQRDQPPEAKR